MPNIAQAFKDEIVRISRKEIKASVGPLHKSNVSLKKVVAELKRKVASLESENKRLKSKTIQTPRVSPEAAEKVRITSKSIKILRSKLGLSQNSFGKLIGVSSQNVYAMEHKDGRRLKLRKNTLANLLSVRGMGKRDVKKRLEEIGKKK